MNEEPFVDYYEVLQVSPNADVDTIQRIFRYLAKRYHPDNSQTGDSDRFGLLVDAQRTLTDPEKRAAYDVRHQKRRGLQWKLVEEAGDSDEFESDQILQERLLWLLYVRRRRDMRNPGIGSLELERLLNCPREHLEFHIWYLREKGWVKRTDSGYLVITADGIDQAQERHLRLRRDRLLTDRANMQERESEEPLEQIGTRSLERPRQ